MDKVRCKNCGNIILFLDNVSFLLQVNTDIDRGILDIENPSEDKLLLKDNLLCRGCTRRRNEKEMVSDQQA